MKGQHRAVQCRAAHVCDKDRAAVAGLGQFPIRADRQRSTLADCSRVRIQALKRARTEIDAVRLVDRTRTCRKLRSMAATESRSVTGPKSRRSAAQAGRPVAPWGAEAEPGLG